MKLLIVEDDVHVIQGIQQNIDWKKLGITDVYPALGSLAARKQLKETKIDLMICDIEMPRETGLDLLEWMRRENMNVQTIFLTSYAKFEYARKAVSVGQKEIHSYLIEFSREMKLRDEGKKANLSGGGIII